MSKSINKKITGFAVISKESGQDTPKGGFTNEADRRLQITAAAFDPKDVLYLERRPHADAGHPARVFMVASPSGKFPVVVTETEGDAPWMFEVWVPGEAPRDLRALAKNISMDMRAQDRAWLKLKLEALLDAEGTPFDLTLPDGSRERVASDAAAMARLLLWRGTTMGAFDGTAATPLIDAMLSRKEPKTMAEGAASWSFDVKNAVVRDDFYMTLKEVSLSDGTIRPISVWTAGKYPRSLDGLCKALSLDMRVYSPAWVLRKLDQLLDIEEPNGGFLGPAPGSEKQQWYPSTVAYIATLIRHRLSTLGLVSTEGQAAGGPTLRLVSPAVASTSPVAERPQGELCGECGAHAVIKVSGCKQCTSCSWSACQ
ncbi:hypothetical protein [Rhodanobacter sp. FW106-PBR-R2A-1-13]|uniref:hypothetical protein n=1 Tax=Rhodanobacter sp. FW106-PBR-R2A-1-13 TaxID=3454845 RepID=UPI0034E379F3